MVIREGAWVDYDPYWSSMPVDHLHAETQRVLEAGNHKRIDVNKWEGKHSYSSEELDHFPEHTHLKELGWRSDGMGHLAHPNGARLVKDQSYYGHIRSIEFRPTELLYQVKSQKASLAESSPMKFKDLFEMKRYSSAYRFTYDPRDPDGSMKYDELRHQIRQHNKANKDDPDSHLRVMRWARLGKNNPNAHKYAEGGEKSFTKQGRQKLVPGRYISPEDASHFDVYVQPKPRKWDIREY